MRYDSAIELADSGTGLGGLDADGLIGVGQRLVSRVAMSSKEAAGLRGCDEDAGFCACCLVKVVSQS